MSIQDSIEISASNVEDAIRQALAHLGAHEDEVAIEVLTTPRSGVLGLGARQARVRVTRRPVAEVVRADAPLSKPPEAQSSPPETQSSSSPRQQQQSQQGQQGRQNQQPRQPQRNRRCDNQGQNQGAQNQGGQNPDGQGSARKEDAARARPSASQSRDEDGGLDDGAPGRKSAGVEEQTREATEILVQILALMGEPTEVRQSDADPESVELEIKGDGSGILIGRHGQTLDALEYIVNRILARRIKDAAPISLETESYRARRRGQLHRMALSMGERAKREHEAVRLDPMPPRDRRVVHLALKDDPMITTRSAGDGFMRSIEIVPVNGGGRRERANANAGANAGGGGQQARSRGRNRNRGRDRDPDRDRDREREKEPERPRESGNDALGEQGGFKHGQKRIV